MRQGLSLLALLTLWAPPLSGQTPRPPAPIAAAKNAAAQVRAAQSGATAPGGKEALAQSQAQAQGQGQAPASTPAARTATAPGAASSASAPPASTYSYDADGRRDPFVSLLNRGAEGTANGVRPAGLAGILIGEMHVKGILKTRTGFIGMVQAADNKSYILHGGDRVMDGVVKSITAEEVVFSQDVNDPLSLVKQREVRKAIRSDGR